MINASIHYLPVKTIWTLPTISSRIVLIISFNRIGLPSLSKLGNGLVVEGEVGEMQVVSSSQGRYGVERRRGRVRVDDDPFNTNPIQKWGKLHKTIGIGQHTIHIQREH